MTSGYKSAQLYIKPVNVNRATLELIIKKAQGFSYNVKYSAMAGCEQYGLDYGQYRLMMSMSSKHIDDIYATADDLKSKIQEIDTIAVKPISDRKN